MPQTGAEIGTFTLLRRKTHNRNYVKKEMPHNRNYVVNFFEVHTIYVCIIALKTCFVNSLSLTL